jgi:hypothetical protein
MASIYNDIRAALENKLANTSNLPAGIAYENVSFSPTTGTSYLQTNFLPTLRRPAVRGLNPQQRYDGVFVVTAYTPATTKISYSGDETITVSIDYAERQQGFLDAPWYYVPINIGWYVYNN